MDNIPKDSTMINNLTCWLRKRYLLSKWRRGRRRKKSLCLNIGNLKSFFQKFNDRNVDYVVLRQFNNVSLTSKEEAFICGNDIDILVNTDDLKLLSLIASQNPGNIKCNVYNLTGRRGMSFLDMPYYPPVLAEIILSKKKQFRNAFNVPEPMTYFRSLAYHLVYHKGLDSGIPSGCHLESCPESKCSYGDFLTELGQSLNIEIKHPYTLLGIHEYLKKTGWGMPYDLIERWPQETNWHKFLLKIETDILKPWADKLPGLLVFFIRQNYQCSDGYSKVEMIYRMLEEKISILKIENLTQEQINNVLKKVRGGNWVAHNGTWINPPKVAVICYDHNPVAVQETDVDVIRNYPNVNNKNVFHKHEIRMRLAKSNNTSQKIFDIHGSDNAYDAQNMLRAIYPQKTSEINRDIFERIQRNTV